MLSRKVLIFYGISAFVCLCWQQSSHAADQQEWFDDQISTRHMIIIFADAEIAKELSMTPDQRIALGELERQLRPRFSEAMRPPKDLRSKSPEEQAEIAEKRQADVDALEQEFRPQIWNALTAAQQERMVQILWQLNAARALSEVDKVTSRIQLDAQQKIALGKILEQYQRDLSATLEVVRPREERLERNEAAETRRDEQVLKLLTDVQRFEWSTLTGNRLDIVALRPRVNMSRSQLDRVKKAMEQEEKMKKKSAANPSS